MKLDREKAAGKPPIMLKLGLLSSQSPSSKTVAHLNGDSLAHRRSGSGQELVEEQPPKRPKSSNGQKMLNPSTKSFDARQLMPEGSPEKIWESQPMKAIHFTPNSGATSGRPPSATPQGSDVQREAINLTQNSRPFSSPFGIRLSFGQNANLNETPRLEPMSSPRQIQHGPLESRKIATPSRSSTSPEKAPKASSDHLPSTAATVSTPGGMGRPYISPYGSAGAARASAHLSLPNDKDASISPRIHLPPWSSPTANGTTPGTLPDASAGLSPTKNATPLSSEPGSFAMRDVQHGNLLWSRSSEGDGQHHDHGTSSWPRTLQQVDEHSRSMSTSTMGQQAPDITPARNDILGKQQEHERKGDRCDDPQDQGVVNGVQAGAVFR